MAGPAIKLLTQLTILSLSSTAAWSAAPNVVVTIKPVHSLVAKIMAGVGSPRLLVEGNASPHTFSLKPSAARAVAEADVFIRVSRAVEPFSERLLATLPASATVITLVDLEGIHLLDRRFGGVFEAHEHSGGHEAPTNTDGEEQQDQAGQHAEDAGDKDGHIWLDPANARIIAAAISKQLVSRYPDARARFESNTGALLAELDALRAEISAAIAPVRGKPYIIFHDGTQYFERAFDIAAAGSITLSPDVPPGAKRLAEVRHRVQELGPVCVFAEPGYRESQLAAVTEGTGARFSTLDIEGLSLSPAPDLYVALMRELTRSLVTCLSSNG